MMKGRGMMKGEGMMKGGGAVIGFGLGRCAALTGRGGVVPEIGDEPLWLL